MQQPMQQQPQIQPQEPPQMQMQMQQQPQQQQQMQQQHVLRLSQQQGKFSPLAGGMQYVQQPQGESGEYQPQVYGQQGAVGQQGMPTQIPVQMPQQPMMQVAQQQEMAQVAQQQPGALPTTLLPAPEEPKPLESIGDKLFKIFTAPSAPAVSVSAAKPSALAERPQSDSRADAHVSSPSAVAATVTDAADRGFFALWSTAGKGGASDNSGNGHGATRVPSDGRARDPTMEHARADTVHGGLAATDRQDGSYDGVLGVWPSRPLPCLPRPSHASLTYTACRARALTT
jgi:hypothetical protein